VRLLLPVPSLHGHTRRLDYVSSLDYVWTFIPFVLDVPVGYVRFVLTVYVYVDLTLRLWSRLFYTFAVDFFRFAGYVFVWVGAVPYTL